MKNAFFGVLCSAFVFGVLFWMTTKRTVHAAVLTAPPAGRFQLVQLHPSSNTEWSGILDTETGCTWVFQSNDPDNPKITEQHIKFYFQILGRNSFGFVNFDPTDYTDVTFSPDNTPNYQDALSELSRVQKACSQARLQALTAAGSH